MLVLPELALADGFERDRTPLSDAVTGVATDAGSTSSGGGGTGALARMIVGLAIVIAVIYGVYWLLKKSSRARGVRGGDGIAVLASAALGPNRGVHLLRVGDEAILVGVGEGTVTKLRVYDAAEAAQLGLLEEEPEDPRLPAPVRPARRQGGAGWSSFVADLQRRTAR